MVERDHLPLGGSWAAERNDDSDPEDRVVLQVLPTTAGSATAPAEAACRCRGVCRTVSRQ